MSRSGFQTGTGQEHAMERGLSMTCILIIDSHTPELLAADATHGASFVRTLLALDPTLELRVVAPYAAPLRPEQLSGVDGVIFSGSGVTWSVDAPEGRAVWDAMELVFEVGQPCWGSCNGMQLAACILGGTVGAAPAGFEVGLAQDLTLSNTGSQHPMMAGRQDGFAVPCIHRDEVLDVPDGAQVLASNAHSVVQAMVYEKSGVNFWGTQYHPELSTLDIADVVRGRGLFHQYPIDVEALDAWC